MVRPRYPVYVVSKGRPGGCLTANFLREDGVDFRLVVEPQERAAYASRYGDSGLLVLPFSNLGQGSIPARNWVWEHARASGAARHWILDDNIHWIYRRWRAKRIRCSAAVALAACEDFFDRYENIAIGGLNYAMFCPDFERISPFVPNVHVYSCLCILNELRYRWRGKYNEDTDLCLQVLSGGWCTVLVNAFQVQKVRSMVLRGGNTTELYRGDGRLRMARSLERLWPGVVETKRRFQRPQHVVRGAWRPFDTPLRLRPGVVVPQEPNEYGMRLRQIKPGIRSADLRRLVGPRLREDAAGTSDEEKESTG